MKHGFNHQSLSKPGHGLPSASAHVEAWIQRCWQRCLAQGMAPQQRVVFNPMSAPAMAPLTGTTPMPP